MINKILMIFLFLILVLPVTGSDLDKKLATHINKHIKNGNYVGLIVGYIKNGKTTIQSFGETQKGNGVKPTSNTVFEISSISKTFAATILADMAAKGEVKLKDPVQKYLPKNVKLAAIDGRDITLEDLATHYSGLPYMPKDYNPQKGINPYKNYGRSQLWKSLKLYEPKTKAGEKHGYSAFGYGTLAEALALKNGVKFEDLVKTYITEPLGMKNTFMTLCKCKDCQKKAATGYNKEGKIALPFDQGAFRGAGSMYSTLDDLLIYLRGHLGLLKNDLSKSMKLTHLLRNPEKTVGLAWHKSKGQKNRSQYGTANGYRAYIGFLDDGSRGVVVLANTSRGAIEIGEYLLFENYKLPEILK